MTHSEGWRKKQNFSSKTREKLLSLEGSPGWILPPLVGQMERGGLLGEEGAHCGAARAPDGILENQACSVGPPPKPAGVLPRDSREKTRDLEE